MEKNTFKYFVQIKSAYKEGGEMYLEGTASGLLDDQNDRRMTTTVIDRFVKTIKESGLPLTDGHLPVDSMIGEIGEVVEASITDEYELFIKCRVDSDHPGAQAVASKVRKGKQLAFSIEGYADPEDLEMVWSDESGKYITKVTDLEPVAITVTTNPAYTPSFAEVVYSSVGIRNLSINNTKMSKKEEIAKIEEEEVVKASEEQITEETSESTETVETSETAETTEETTGNVTARLEALEAKIAELSKVEEEVEVQNSTSNESNILSSVDEKLGLILDVAKGLDDRIENLESLSKGKKSRVLSTDQNEGVTEPKAPETFSEKYKALVSKE